LAGVLERDGGEFLFDGQDLFGDRKRRSQLVGYVPQGTPLIDELTAKDNLLLWYSREEMKQELQNGVLKMLGVDAFLKVPVRKMSGGMKKRLSIGCAMAKKPPILLLDEPTAALDLACKQDIGNYLTQYKRAGGLLLLTTHDALELSLCDKIYIMKDGVLQEHNYEGDLKRLVDCL
jgi:ABC-2 type transport system ATP-binding protein